MVVETRFVDRLFLELPRTWLGRAVNESTAAGHCGGRRRRRIRNRLARLATSLSCLLPSDSLVRYPPLFIPCLSPSSRRKTSLRNTVSYRTGCDCRDYADNRKSPDSAAFSFCARCHTRIDADKRTLGESKLQNCPIRTLYCRQIRHDAISRCHRRDHCDPIIKITFPPDGTT